jgi:signal transduction histidine kinase
MTRQPLRLLGLFFAIAVACFAIGEVAVALAGGRSVGGGGVGTTVVTAMVAALVLTAVAAAWHSSRWHDPATDLVATIDRLTAGEWDLHADPRGAVTIQALAQRVNRLAQNVRAQLDDVRIGRGDLQTLVDTLPDPIIATDAAGRIVLINRPASRLLDLPRSAALGTKLVGAVNDNALLELFDAATKERDRHDDDEQLATIASGSATTDTDAVRRPIKLLRSGNRLTFDGYATRTVGGGALLVLRDVTQLAATLQMKTDFVANASHELRTPLAAIKIAFETLGDVYSDDPQQAARCIAIIGGHLNRLEEMLRDLLDLSRVESADLNPQPQRVKAAEVFALVRSALGTFAREKGLDLRLETDGSVDTFLADERLLNLALKNLAENSIKFTPAGGSVTISFKRGGGGDGQGVTIAVADTGIGIPVEHQARVFERFYQVDPARSGSAGRGTGLGLAIVKHAVAGLGGAVELASTPGKGTTVRVILPDAGSGMPDEQDEHAALPVSV